MAWLNNIAAVVSIGCLLLCCALSLIYGDVNNLTATDPKTGLGGEKFFRFMSCVCIYSFVGVQLRCMLRVSCIISWLFLPGFAPFGLKGIAQGAGTSFMAFVGIEAVVCLAEEAKDPKVDIPRATFGSFGFGKSDEFSVTNFKPFKVQLSNLTINISRTSKSRK